MDLILMGIVTNGLKPRGITKGLSVFFRKSFLPWKGGFKKLKTLKSLCAWHFHLVSNLAWLFSGNFFVAAAHLLYLLCSSSSSSSSSYPPPSLSLSLSVTLNDFITYMTAHTAWHADDEGELSSLKELSSTYIYLLARCASL